MAKYFVANYIQMILDNRILLEKAVPTKAWEIKKKSDFLEMALSK